MTSNATSATARTVRAAAALALTAAAVQLSAATAYAADGKPDMTYECIDVNGNKLVPGDAVQCTLTMSTKEDAKFTSASAELSVPKGARHLTGGALQAGKVSFSLPEINKTTPASVSFRFVIENDTAPGTKISSTAQVTGVAKLPTFTEQFNVSTNSAALETAAPDGAPAQGAGQLTAKKQILVVNNFGQTTRAVEQLVEAPQGAQLEIVSATEPAKKNGTVTISADKKKVTFTPNCMTEGTDSFTVKVKNGADTVDVPFEITIDPKGVNTLIACK